MRRVSDSQDLEREWERLDGVIDRKARLPDVVVRTGADVLGLCDFDVIWNESWFERIKALSVSDIAFRLMVLSPDPLKYYQHYFSMLPLLIVEVSDSFQKYLDVLQQDPGQSPADAIQHGAEVLCAYDDDMRWVWLCDRGLELGVVATVDAELSSEMRQAFGEFLLTPQQAIETILSSVYLRSVPHDVASALLRHYGDATGRP